MSLDMDKLRIVSFKLTILTALVVVNQQVAGSPKKGVAVGPKNFMCDDFKKLDHTSWWYDWGANLHMIKKYSNCTNLDNYLDTFIPTIWGPWNILSIQIPSQAAYIFGFNEPNHKEQSNLTPERAAKAWPEIEQLAKGRILVSPSAAPCGGPNCIGNATEWFDGFFKYCKGCRVDFLNTHFYGCNADTAMKYLTNLYDRYKKKIWLTEFACPGHTATPEKELAYMKELLPRLESAPFIYRYSWYASRLRGGAWVGAAASLLEPDSSTLTELGRFYNSFKSGNSSP